MKKTISVTLSGVIFNIEEDAYKKLEAYLNSVSDNYDSSEADEILADIESSIAEKFSEKLKGRKKVITIADVEMVIKVMGTVEEFNNDFSEANQPSKKPGSFSEKSRKLYRNPDDVIIAGVCSGLAAYFGIDPVFVRLLFIVLAFLNGFGILAYLVLWVVMPVASTNVQKLAMQGKPINLKKIEQVVKEKSKVVKKEGKQALSKLGKSKNLFYRILNLPIKILEATFSFIRTIGRTIGPATSIFFGVIFVIAAVVTMLSLVIALFGVIFYIDSPYLISDLPLEELSSLPLYYLAVISVFVFAVVPFIFLYILGLTMTKRRNSFRANISGILIGLWLISIAGAIVAGGDLVPRVNNRLAEIYAAETITKDYNYRSFSKLYLGGNMDVTVKQGNAYSISMTGRERDLDRLSFEIEEGQLQIVQKSRQEKGKLCFFCFDKQIKAEITMPKLESLVAFRQAEVRPEGFNGDIYVSLGESAEAEIDLADQDLSCSLSGSGSKLKLTGQTDLIDCQLNGFAKLQADDLTADQVNLKQQLFSKVSLVGSAGQLNVELEDQARLNAFDFYADEIIIKTYNNSKAEIRPLDKLLAIASDYSDIKYRGLPRELTVREVDRGEVEREDDDEVLNINGQKVIFTSGDDRGIAIGFDADMFSPTMSSIRGIGLTPVAFEGNEDLANYQFEWQTNNGYFVEDWSSPDYSQEVIIGNEKIYWTFFPNSNLVDEDRPVIIELKAENLETGKIEAVNFLQLDWEDDGTVKVSD